MSEWQPISTVPRDQPVDLWVPEPCGFPWGRLTNCHWSESSHGWLVYVEGKKVRIPPFEPTHWMRIPDPPEAPEPKRKKR